MRRRKLSRRENRRNFANTAGYVNKKNMGGNYIMRTGSRVN